ncbi:MAG: ABC transporter substrate-binding protein [Promethearchaeota archaeon]
MEQLTKRILAIVLIAVIGTGIGITAWYFLAQPTDPYKYPGAPSDHPNIIKIGCAGDTGEIQGDANWEGAYLAAKQINANGGVDVGGTTYYIGLTREDTDESNPNLVTSRGVNAARRLIYNKKVDFALGGFRSEALLAYQEEFMDAKMIFIDTGASTDIFCTNVITNYSRYKYMFRFMPINSSMLAKEILTTVIGVVLTLNATFPSHDIRKVGLLAEDLTWTEGMVAFLAGYLPKSTNWTGTPWIQVLTPIRYDVTLGATDMNSHLATLQSQGADVVIPIISGQGGVLMMQQYGLNKYDYIIFGIDVQAQLDTFWTESGESCAYETIMQTLHKTNKSATTLQFWDDFLAEWDHEPLYIAAGAYDAVYALRDAIEATDSLDTNDIIAEFETWTTGNPHPGVSGGGAWWPKSHDLVEGYPFSHTLWCQWYPDGSKKVVSGFGLYPEWMTTGAFLVPPWVNTTWSS